MDTIKKIGEFQKFGSRLGLERMTKLMDLLDNPQEGLNYIHVGGTNGKGSVCWYIYSVLRANGYNVGMFTSPFMDGFRQAIIVDDVFMTKAELDANYAAIEEAVDKMKEEGFDSPTEFEIITALSLLYFKSRNPDFVIMEVGLGGIGDSTNIIGKPLVSVITSVSLDHCDVLGETIEAIALEKAGIIKEQTTVVSNVDGEAAKVIAREAYKKSAPLIDATKYKAVGTLVDFDGNRFTVSIDGISYPDMQTSLPGAHQIKNAICALTVIEQLRKKAKITLDKDATQKGLKNAKPEGRMEIINNDPLVILDGAHNAEGAKALAQYMVSFFSDKKVLTIFSLMKDKEPENVIDEFVKFSDELIIADVLEDKPVDARGLLDITQDKVRNSTEWHIQIDPSAIRIITDEASLLSTIKENSHSGSGFDIVLITGSLYLIRQLRPSLINL